MRFMISIFLLLVSVGAHAKPELGHLIKAAVTQQQEARLPWSFMAESDSPVTWKTIGINNGNRVGSLIISVDGFTPQVISQTVQDAHWTIRVSGDKFGIKTVALDSEDACFGSASVSSKCIEQISDVERTLKAAGVSSQLICKFGPGAEVSEVRRISIPGHTPAFFHTIINSGSGGSSFRASILFKSTSKASELEHSTAVCSILFANHDGQESSISYDYKSQLGIQ